ncbi:synaptosomal-associated protein 29 [Caerostris darwini]|uniref:Synaptosomal-associated protein 29 n=1 Tax=Caerostris darwini TaxID=1538125 RepID=A0AAV4WSA6_9ARAC|nr:synaptosomal-associated protein 29 [Caerostris darwini]
MAKEVKSANPFLDDDEDIDDNDFLNHPRQGKSGYMFGNDSGNEQNEWEIKRKQLLEERRRIEERTLQSTNNSLGLLHESEQVGILTAEELVKQREQLENIEENLDIINNTMRTSQKHINSLKSIFGGIKNYFSKGGEADPALKTQTTEVPERKQTSALSSTIDTLKTDTRLSEATHPALRIRNLPYDEPDSLRNELFTQEKISSPPAAKNTNNIEEKLDKNLEFMSMGLGRLKNLAIGLNEEIEQQNDMIDTIHNKADKADETLEYQNRQIKRILKK